jgi:DNA-binding response OmpR family regulator
VSQPVPGQPTRKRLILVAEDEFFLAAELTSVLEKAGYDVIASGEVQEVLDILKREHPDAAVLDVNLSDGSVTPVAAVLKSMDVPFVLATALSDTEISENVVLQGTLNLSKPTEARKLLAAIEALLHVPPC